MMPFAARNRFSGKEYLVLAFLQDPNEGTMAVVAEIGGALSTVYVENLEVWRPTSEWPISQGRFWAYDPDAVKA